MRRALVATLALAVVAAGAPGIDAAEARQVCAAPKALAFKRAPGASSGKLSWKPPRGARRGTRYRVFRDRDVIGQTRRGSMMVRVSVDRTYRFSVRVVSPSGRLLPCSAGVRRRVTYILPRKPPHLSVTGSNGPVAHLSWSRSRRGDGRVVAYRVLRGGATFRQLAGTEVDVPIANSRTYRFEVAAVDSHGRLSPLSDPVTVETGHQPPPAPATVLATDVSDSEVTLSWSPSQPARGRISGYRVFRDGRPLRQVAGLSTRVTNLAAGTSHTFTVAAVDSAGWISAQSAPAHVTVAPPIPTTGTSHAFLLASTDRSFADFREHYRQIGWSTRPTTTARPRPSSPAATTR